MHALNKLMGTAGLVLLAACATTTDGRYAGNVIAVEATAVGRCTLLDDLGSSSGLVGFFGPKGVDNIKQNLLRQADVIGATHVVWGVPSVGYASTSLSAKAYRCPSP